LKISLIKPSDSLKDVVKHYLVIESLDLNEKLWLLPNAGNFILFNPGLVALLDKYDTGKEAFLLPKDFSVAFKAKNIVRLSINEETKLTHPVVGVELLPTGCNRLFADENTDRKGVYALLKDCIKEREVSFDKLYDFKSIDEQITYIEKGLLSLKQSAACMNETCDVIERVIDYIEETLYKVNVSDILEKFKYSRTSLERDFKKTVGYTPKEFIQIRRFGIIFIYLMTNGYDFMKLEYDFFDQSHMNKAFKKFIDIPPSKLQAFVKDNNIQIYQLFQAHE